MVLVFGANVGEDVKSGLSGENINVNLLEIVYVYVHLCHFSLSQAGVLSEDGGVLLFSVDVSFRMHELASLTERTVVILVELVTCFGHVLLGHVGLLLQLMRSVSVGAFVSPVAPSS